MKKTSLLLLPLILLAACGEDFSRMPSGPSVARRVEQTDGGRGDVPGVNHPNLNPNGGYHDEYYSGGYYGRPYYNNGRGYYR
jgi:hypothetical protein